MTIQKLCAAIFGILLTLSIGCSELRAQANSYQKMSQAERAQFVAAQARRIAGEISGRDYEFTPAFLEDIQQSLNQYTRRIGNENGNAEKRDLRFVMERGQANAATLSAAFKARNLSPLLGLYIPWVESEYVNIPSPNAMGAIGMFQFLPKTGERYGLSATDLLDVAKSADAAARYITDSVDQFKDDPMREALALLSYNRGTQQTARDLKALVNEQNRHCSICALSADRGKLDETFRVESVYYVPRFFAAAIIGENPAAFGLKGQPLSSN
ncbi:MAG TPA: transglycosylase SLT domain-containing protein [Pyrinomonadaceae bacterium]|jgi:hypothetical protein